MIAVTITIPVKEMPDASLMLMVMLNASVMPVTLEVTAQQILLTVLVQIPVTMVALVRMSQEDINVTA